MMIVLIEKDWMEAEDTLRELQHAFPSCRFRSFLTLGDFLMEDGDFVGIDLVITEHFLSLMEPQPGHDEYLSKLASRFPEVVTDWDHRVAARRLFDLIRKRRYRFRLLSTLIANSLGSRNRYQQVPR